MPGADGLGRARGKSASGTPQPFRSQPGTLFGSADQVKAVRMLDPALIPTRLPGPPQRLPIAIAKERPPPNFLVTRTCLRFLGWALQGLFLRLIRAKSYKVEQARRLRILFEELGGFWVKVGQLMSVRRDIFSFEICDELSKLQDRATGFPFDMARFMIEQALGRDLSEVFDVFDEAPFAAASIGQIHRAHLRHEKIWVAVKVQRPYVAQTISENLAFVKRITDLLEALSIRRHAHWREGYWEIDHILREEVDYRFEASNIERIGKTLRRHRIVVPQVYEKYSAQRVLVMEFVTGALMAEFLNALQADPRSVAAWCRENNVSPRRVARRLHLSMLRQILEDNLYHGDLHPGNIILLRDSNIALIDCGTIGFLELEYLQKFRLFMKSLVELDYDKAADLSFLLSGSLPVRDLEPMKEDLVRTLRAWGARTFVKKLPYAEKSVPNVWEECNKIYLKYKCTFEWQTLRVLRSLTTLDASLSRLNPEVNHTELGQAYFRQAEQRTLRQFVTRRSMRQVMMNLVIAGDLPAKAAELAFFNASLARRHAKVFEGATTKASNMFAVLFYNLTLQCFFVGLWIVLILLDRYFPALVSPILIGIIGRAVHGAPALETDTWVVLLIMLAYAGRTFAGLRGRFGRREMSGMDRPLNA
jgi:ubiquinone biosynthesis protein